MGTLVRTWTLLLLVKLSYAGKTVDVDVLGPGGLDTLEEEQILRVLSRNKTSSTNNFTLIELIGNLKNHTIEESKDPWRQEKLMTRDSNPFYDDFAEEIDREARALFQVLPAYDPGVGRVSPQCKKHADIFQQELAKFTLWALKNDPISSRSGHRKTYSFKKI